MSHLSLARQLAGLLESLGDALVLRSAALNFWTAALLGGALLLDRALARRARASLRIALYAPVAVRIALPLGWSLRTTGAPSVDALLAPLTTLSAQGEGANVPVAFAPSWHALVAAIYAAVAVALATRTVLARVRLGRALAHARRVPLGAAALPCPALAHATLGPMAFGLVAPRIVVPERLLAPSEARALEGVLRHEAAHVRRGDAWLSALMQLLVVVAWPVAPLWLAVARVRHLMELACDEAAVEGRSAEERRAYGHALLDVAEWAEVRAPGHAAALHFGSSLRARIEALASMRPWPLAAQRLAVVLAPAALLVACGAGAPPAASAATSAAPSDEGYGYEFDVDSPKEAAAAKPSAPLSPDAHGRIPPENIQAIVRARFGAVRACYDAGRKRDPKLAGVVRVKIVFGPDGATKDAADERSTLADKDVVACVVAELRNLTYAKGPPGDVTFIYPIQLTPLN